MINNELGSPQRFGYAWKKFNQILPIHEKQFQRWIGNLPPEYFKGKIVLDAGCGIGRNSFWPLKYEAKHVIAFDYEGTTVHVAKANLINFKNCDVQQASIYDFECNFTGDFDFVQSIGVIHHLDNPNLALDNLVRQTKRGGMVLIWLYAREGNENLLRLLLPIRKLSKLLPMPILNLISYLMTIPFYIFLKFFPIKHEYYYNAKEFSLQHLRSIILDQLLPRIAKYYSKEEALNLLRTAKLVDIEIYKINGNSWTVTGYRA